MSYNFIAAAMMVVGRFPKLWPKVAINDEIDEFEDEPFKSTQIYRKIC